MDHETKHQIISIVIDKVPRSEERFNENHQIASVSAWMRVRNAQSLIHNFRRPSVRILLNRFLYALVPQLIRTKVFNDTVPVPKVGSTSWMDGFRGLAAIAVLNFHFFFAYSSTPVLGWGATVDDHWLVQLPVLHLGMDGATCVNIFFTVAGYVCSTKVLWLMSDGEYGKALQSLSASVFRRFFRLYLPVFCITFVWAMMAYVGCFDLLRPMMDDKKKYFHRSFSEVNLQRFSSLADQVYYWMSDMFRLGNIWSVGPVYAAHDNHLWTIAYEYRTSMHLYVALLGLATCTPCTRLIWLCVLAMIYLLWDRWEGPLFFIGAAMAQWDVIRKHGQTLPSACDNISSPIFPARRRIVTRLIRILGYVVGLYFMSFPIGGYKMPDPLFAWFNPFIPSWYKRKEKYPKTWGTLLFFFMLTTSENTIASPKPSVFHRMFNSDFAQYCGKIMFALYLVHGNIFHIIGYSFPHWIWACIGDETITRHITGLVLGWAANLILCFWAADVFTREIDTRCAKLIKHFETWCFAKS